MKPFVKILLVSFILYFFSWFAVYTLGINKLAIQSEDAVPAAFLPFSIIKEKTLYLDSFYDMMLARYPHPDDKNYERGLTPYYLRKVEDFSFCSDNGNDLVLCTPQIHYVSAFPIITPILTLPIYFLPAVFNMNITWDLVYILNHISAALIVAVSGGALFLLLRDHFSLEEKMSYILTAIYLFATINFSLLSQSLWQHGTLELFIILSLLFLYKRKFFWYSTMFCLAVLSRPTAAFIFPLMVIYTLIYIKKNKLSIWRSSVYALLGSIIPIVFFFWYNSVFYHGISNQGYYDQLTSEWLSRFPEGFLGLWISPSKGLLVYSPVFLFSLYGFYIWARSYKDKGDYSYLFFMLIVLVHTLILGKWKHWYGGYSFGYRMASDIVPFLILLMVPYVKSENFKKTYKIFFGSILISVFIQVSGIIFFDGIWHAAYDRGFRETRWLWSIKDSELLFNIRRILVKLGILKQACPKCLPA